MKYNNNLQYHKILLGYSKIMLFQNFFVPLFWHEWVLEELSLLKIKLLEVSNKALTPPPPTLLEKKIKQAGAELCQAQQA